MRSGEFATIGRLKERFANVGGPLRGVLLGIGDDAAVLAAPAGGQVVWTVDQQVEGTHFRRNLVGWEDLGWRSFSAAASDLAAMGATPWCALTALSISADVDDADLDALAVGQQSAAERIGAPIVGGNVTRSGLFVVTTTLLGTCERAIERGGARAGDGVWVSGALGLAAAGFIALERAVLDSRVDRATNAWLRPQARVTEGLAMASVAHAAIDVSDGFAQDLAHLCAASGVRAVLDEAALRAHAAATGLDEAAAALETDPLELLLRGGEDYALVVASPVAIQGFVQLGRLVEGQGIAIGEREIDARGYDHLR